MTVVHRYYFLFAAYLSGENKDDPRSKYVSGTFSSVKSNVFSTVFVIWGNANIERNISNAMLTYSEFQLVGDCIFTTVGEELNSRFRTPK